MLLQELDTGKHSADMQTGPT